MHGFSVVEMWNSMGLLSKGITLFMILMAIYMLAIIIERAIRFYVRNGFQSTGAVRDFFGMPFFEYAKDLRESSR